MFGGGHTLEVGPGLPTNGSCAHQHTKLCPVLCHSGLKLVWVHGWVLKYEFKFDNICASLSEWLGAAKKDARARATDALCGDMSKYRRGARTSKPKSAFLVGIHACVLGCEVPVAKYFMEPTCLGP